MNRNNSGLPQEFLNTTLTDRYTTAPEFFHETRGMVWFYIKIQGTNESFIRVATGDVASLCFSLVSEMVKVRWAKLGSSRSVIVYAVDEFIF